MDPLSSSKDECMFHWTPNSTMTLCMNNMTLQLLATLDGGKCMNSCPTTTGGQECHIMLQPMSLLVIPATGVEDKTS
jgi:hypothetical protein